jgi:cell division transport system permease protein
MAIKVDYIAREVGTNLRRNLTLTLASVLTVAVSLSLVGSALLIRQGVQNATARWNNGIEFIVFMNPDVSAEQDAAVRRDLEESPQVDEFTYIDKDQAVEEFQDLFADTPGMVESVTPDILPPSYRVVPRDTDAAAIAALGETFESKPGVREVVFAAETVKTFQRLSQILSLAILGVAVVLALASLMLILNTIRMAMFARRREIQVMKLVGATNWFIRIPFMVEGLIQGFFGALIAVGAVFGLNVVFNRQLDNADDLVLLQGIVVDNADVMFISLLVLIVGCLIGFIGSAFAVSRFLDV